MGNFMWGVFTNYMNLSDSDIIAMTAANFSYETDPRNPEAVYQGASIYTRCVWEVKLGNAVSTNISTRIADDRPLESTAARSSMVAGPMRR